MVIFDTKIVCPECGTVQDAIVWSMPDLAWPVYAHVCDECDYVILESEWDEVEAQREEAQDE